MKLWKHPFRLGLPPIIAIVVALFSGATVAADRQAVTSGTGIRANGTASDPRHLVSLEGLVDFRDLGGCRNSTGHQFKRGQLYWSDHLAHLSDTDLSESERRKMGSVIDLRSDFEAGEFDPRTLRPLALDASHRLGTEGREHYARFPVWFGRFLCT